MTAPTMSLNSPRYLQAAVVVLATAVINGCGGEKSVGIEKPSATPSGAYERLPSNVARFLALGDSYTIGESVSDSERWPVQLTKLLRAEGVELETPTIIARTGWTSGELLAAIRDAPPTGVFEIVSLQIGVNNQYRGLDEQQYVGELDELIDLAVGFAGGDPSRVVVLSIPDWGVTPFAIGRDRAGVAAEIDRFNDLKRERAFQRGCHFVDVTPISRAASDDPSLSADDGLHPSGKMYARWCELALPAARLALAVRASD